MEKIALVRYEDKLAFFDDTHLFCGIILALELAKGELFTIVWHEAWKHFEFACCIFDEFFTLLFFCCAHFRGAHLWITEHLRLCKACLDIEEMDSLAVWATSHKSSIWRDAINKCWSWATSQLFYELTLLYSVQMEPNAIFDSNMQNCTILREGKSCDLLLVCWEDGLLFEELGIPCKEE